MPERRGFKTRKGTQQLDRSKSQTFSEERWGWVRHHAGQLVLWVTNRTDENDQPIDEIEHVSIYVNTNRRPDTVIHLSTMTEAELLEIRDLFNTAIDWALPISRRLDKEASDAFAKGDDSHTRIYRSLPQVVYRSRPPAEHFEGVHDGPSDDADLGEPGSDTGELRDALDTVAQRDADGLGTQDDGTATD